MDEMLRCWRCHDVIGVYEPMVVLSGGESRRTSALNERLHHPLGECYHQTCLQQAREAGHQACLQQAREAGTD